MKIRYKAKVQISKMIDVVFALPEWADEHTIEIEATLHVKDVWGDEYTYCCVAYEEVQS